MECPCPRWYSGNPVGTYDWSTQTPPDCTIEPDNRERNYKTEIAYECPIGYIFNQTNMDEPGPETSELIFTCEWWNDWAPAIQPTCISINYLSKKAAFLFM